jgi:hypothetical protein
MSGHVDPSLLPERVLFISKPFLVKDLYSAVENALVNPEW